VTGAIFLAASDENYRYSPSDLQIAEAIALQVAASVEKAKLFSQKEKALDIAQTDLEIGRQIQAGFFPGDLQDIKGWEIFAHFKAARQVSGDFYDVFQINNSKYTAFLIGDVCDKGVGAALFMVLFRTLLRAYSQKNEIVKDIKSLLQDIILNTNNYIAETHYNSNMFASIFFGILDPDTDEIHYINAGLEPPVIINSEGDIINRLCPTGPVIGMFPNLAFTVSTIKLKPGDILFAYTDGTTDAKNSNHESFGEKNLLEVIAASWASGFSMLYDLNSKLIGHIDSQDQYDDITQIAIRKKLTLIENKHSIVRKASQDNLEDLRNFIEKAAIYCKLNDDKVFAYKLATEEICTNIIKHGYDVIEKGEIKLEFLVDTSKAVLKIIDYGKQFIPEEFELPDINEDWEDRKIGGLGVTLVKGLMDKVQYSKGEDNSNCITLELKIL
jgi:serine phosphatase RsbU (regulator of sigma subunit)/anti-sigma regulatory factor (Ser/Thr protein kinase)